MESLRRRGAAARFAVAIRVIGWLERCAEEDEHVEGPWALCLSLSGTSGEAAALCEQCARVRGRRSVSYTHLTLPTILRV